MRIGIIGGEALDALVDRVDLVVVTTDVNSHNAVQRARRLAREKGKRVHLARRLGLSRFVELMALLALVCGPALARADETAQPSPAPAVAPDPRVAELLANQHALEERVHVLEAARKKGEEKWIGFGAEGLWLGGASAPFQLRLHALVQVDGRAFLEDDAQLLTDTFVLRRIRPIIEGTIGEWVDFRIVPDFGNGTVVVQDAFVELTPWSWLRLRGGKFKTPLGLERLQNDAYMPFIERGLPSQLVPDRDIGAILLGDVEGGALSYQFGVFNGAPDGANNDADTNDGKDLVARVFAHPLRPLGSKVVDRLGLGMAVTYGNEHGNPTNTSLGPYKSGGQNTFFSYRNDTKTNVIVIAAGERLRFAPQLYWYLGPVGLLGEYVYAQTHVNNGSVSAELSNQAWQIELTFVLTLERAGYDGVSPKKPLTFKQRGWGAWELGVRYGELYVDDAAFPRFADPTKSAKSAKAWALVLNWWASRYVRLAVSFERTIYSGGAASGARITDRAPENALLGRLQTAL
jgi:phosphate-selective porin OprO/OprP